MIKLSHIAAVFFFLCSLAAAREIYNLTAAKNRMQTNYQIATAEKEGLRRHYRGQIAMYEARPQQFTRDEFNTLFQSLADSLSRQLGLVKVSVLQEIRATQQIDTVVTATDTTLNKSTAKRWIFTTPSIQIRALEIGDTRRLSIRQNIELTITRSLERRKGLVNKIFLIPLKRKPVYTVVPSDSALVIERFSVLEID